MLAGLQSEVESMFPALRDLTPPEEDIEAGAQKLKFGRVIKISGYHTELFDMHDKHEREAYNKRMFDLSQRSQVGVVRILVHDRQTLSRGDGSNGWFSYLEWMEYERTDQTTSNEAEKKETKHGKAG